MLTERTILIVDDEDDIREVAQLSLEVVAGWKVLAANSGESAIAMAGAEQPDAILLDVMMPNLDGPSTYVRLQADESTRAIPVIFLTAKVQSSDRERFAELGVRGIIAKPFDPLELAEEVSRTLGWSD